MCDRAVLRPLYTLNSLNNQVLFHCSPDLLQLQGRKVQSSLRLDVTRSIMTFGGNNNNNNNNLSPQPARSISYTPKHCLATPDTTAPAPPDGSAWWNRWHLSRENKSSWWFQPSWKTMIVNMEIIPKYGIDRENRGDLPTSSSSWSLKRRSLFGKLKKVTIRVGYQSIHAITVESDQKNPPRN